MDINFLTSSKIKLVLIWIFFPLFTFAQKTEKLRLQDFLVAKLSDSLSESSGLDFVHGKLYTFNDSGNTSELFEIDKKSGKILNTLKTNLANKDWEALTHDEDHFYIGDFGNNVGSRKDLSIYKILFKENTLQLDSTKNLRFYYPEQKDFTPRNLNHNFDAEALIFLNKKLHIFTKEWVSKDVSHYILDPNDNSLQGATKVETTHLGYSATDAAYFDHKLYVVGYTKTAGVFMSVFNETQPGVFFKENPIKYHVGSAFFIGQIEGIAVDEDGIYLTSEAFKSPLGILRQRFYFIPHEKLDKKF